MLPSEGTLYDLAFNYRYQGYKSGFPKLGVAISSVPHNVPSDNKIVWVAPNYFVNTTFRYVAVDAFTRWSYTGFVLIVANTNTDNIVASNYFHTDNQQWTAGTDAYQTAVTWTATSMG